MTARATAQASGPPPKVVPCMPAWMACETSSVQSMRAEGHAAGERLGEGGDVGQDAVMLVGEQLAGAAQAGLNLVGDEQRAGGVGEVARGLEKLARDGTDAALALNGLDEDGADFGGEFRAEVVDVVEADEFDARHTGMRRARGTCPCRWSATEPMVRP